MVVAYRTSLEDRTLRDKLVDGYQASMQDLRYYLILGIG
jgi:hypothetical protein